MKKRRPRDTLVQKATSDNENVDAVYRHALDITRCGCTLTSCPGRVPSYTAQCCCYWCNQWRVALVKVLCRPTTQDTFNK